MGRAIAVENDSGFISLSANGSFRRHVPR